VKNQGRRTPSRFELAGEEVPIVWRGRRATAIVPARLADRDLALDPATAAAAATAAAEVTRAAESLVVDLEPLARLLLRSEGVASSFIEGVAAPVLDVVLAEEGSGSGEPAAWVAASLGATSDAIEHAASGAPLDADTLLGWHRRLMAGSPTPERFIGRFRDEQGWIGGTSPFDAHLVTPPPDRVEGLVADLIEWVNGDGVDPIVQAAVAHAQFELVHPFADGNGRIGRVLVGWVLVRRLGLLVPPPVSVAIAADTGGYAAGLVQFRMSDHLAWVRWFAGAVAAGGRAQRELIAEVDRIEERWRQRLRDRRVRADAAAWRALDLLPRHLVLTAPALAAELHVTPKAAIDTLARLVEAGILTEVGSLATSGPGRRPRLYAAAELLGLAGSSPLRG